MNRPVVLYIAMALLIPQLGAAQVGKRLKLNGKKTQNKRHAESVIQVGSVRLTRADARAFKGEQRRQFIKKLPKEGKMVCVIGRFDGIDKTFRDTLHARYPEIDLLEEGKDNIVILAKPVDARSLPMLEGVDIVEWLSPERKISSELRELISLRSRAKEQGTPGKPNQLKPLKIVPHGQAPALTQATEVALAKETIDVNFYLFKGQPLKEVEDLIVASEGNVSGSGSDDNISVVRATIPIKAIAEIAKKHSVREITSDAKFIKHNDVAQQVLVRNPPVYVPPIQGSGQTVGHSDSGLDIGVNDNTIHDAFKGRIKKAFALGRPSPSSWSDRGGHGTHTAGSILGGGRFAGVAPKAKLVHQSLDDENGELGGIPTPLGNLFQQAYDEGARVHSNSWGVSAFDQFGNNVRGGRYLQAQEVDSWSWNNGDPRDMLIVFSAGNDGRNNATMTVTAPGTAKNCLTVGASENRRPEGGAGGDSIDDLANFSSKGPTREDRIKPDVVAPGTWITSAKTQAADTIWHENIESASVGTTASQWGMTAGITLVNNPTGGAFSGTTAFRLRRTSGSRFQDILRSPEVAIPAGHNLRVEVWCRGNAEGLDSLQFGFITSSGLLVFPNEDRRVFNRWTVLSFPISEELEGTTIRLAVVAQEAGGLTNDIELFIDDIFVTTFSSWDALSTLGLAQPNDAIDTAYTLSGGTSMSTPLVAGCAVLVRQSLVDAGETHPSAELVKGILINSADPHQGGRPNFLSGWGLVNLRRAIEADFLFDYESSLSSGDDDITYEVEVPAGTGEVRATLVWADPPSASLVNDLDLMLETPAGEIVPAADQDGASPDRTNNVECIDQDDPVSGTWKVTVSPHRISQGQSQPFAMVVSVLD